ncbi:MAG TPA: hypothetical protein VMT99_02355 [Candidatus Paceibacterota bacterium]|nr:hypothetical protein [Candidatus Paceibacterota bacterium]
MWQHWINFILGLLLIIFSYTGASTTTFIILGILVVIFSLWGGLSRPAATSRA